MSTIEVDTINTLCDASEQADRALTLEVWLHAQLPSISGKSPLAGAIRYALTRMARLRSYLDHGILELDNNIAERAMRSVAIGRKNYLFVGSQTGGRAAAIAYTLIETAKTQQCRSAGMAGRHARPYPRLQNQPRR